MNFRRTQFAACVVAGATIGAKLASGSVAAVVVGSVGLLAIAVVAKIDRREGYANEVQGLLDQYDSQFEAALEELKTSMHSAIQSLGPGTTASAESEDAANLERILGETIDLIDRSSRTAWDIDQITEFQDLASEFHEAFVEADMGTADDMAQISSQIRQNELKYEQANRAAIAELSAALDTLEPPSSLRAAHVRAADAFRAFGDEIFETRQPEVGVSSSSDVLRERFKVLANEVQASFTELNLSIAGRR